MNIQVEPKAQAWFKREMDVESGTYVRFFVRYGGSSPLHQGFSLGVNKDEPMIIGAKAIIDDAVYFIEERDLWFFEGHDLHVLYNEDLDEPTYDYVK